MLKMQKEMCTLISDDIRQASKGEDMKSLFNAFSRAIEAIMNCQMKSSDRVKNFTKDIQDLKNDIIKKMNELDSNFKSCPARFNDSVDHEKLSELEKRIEVLERNSLIEQTQRETIGRMAKALYAVGGVVGGAGIFKALEILSNMVG